jgi:2-C-methyl-D-erythritol 2,4-cyclodiphosphate synthase/2-C-methyl-D-erythritol 4-phosphate cytidylyltransferase
MVKKEYLPLGQGARDGDGTSLTVLGASLAAFAAFPAIKHIVITVPERGEAAARKAIPARFFAPGSRPEILFAPGGPTRRSSVHHALSLLAAYQPAYVLIHDGARPWVDAPLIERVIAMVQKHRAVVPLLPLLETPKETGEDGFVKRHLRRAGIGAAQTPQAFAFPEILRAHEKAAERVREQGAAEYTDDAEVWGEFCGPVAAVPGSPENKKITYPEDLMGQNIIRVGLGQDLHRLVQGRRFLLAGVELEADKGELGHSDGDVLAHAVTDAVLGAAALGDIGALFPPSDPRWKDADSMELLRTAFGKAKEQGWRLRNLDCVVTCEKVKVAPCRERIRASLAAALGAGPEAIFVKGKTAEGLGPIGAGEAVAAEAICLLEKIS